MCSSTFRMMSHLETDLRDDLPDTMTQSLLAVSRQRAISDATVNKDNLADRGISLIEVKSEQKALAAMSPRYISDFVPGFSSLVLPPEETLNQDEDENIVPEKPKGLLSRLFGGCFSSASQTSQKSAIAMRNHR